jgi:hypothetical protein
MRRNDNSCHFGGTVRLSSAIPVMADKEQSQRSHNNSYQQTYNRPAHSRFPMHEKII